MLKRIIDVVMADTTNTVPNPQAVNTDKWEEFAEWQQQRSRVTRGDLTEGQRQAQPLLDKDK